jgi:hypothetical protein
MDLDSLNEEIKKLMDARNNKGIPEFEDYSPFEMHNIVQNLFDENCPIKIKKLKTADFHRIPIFNGVKFLLDQLSATEGIKLTAKGYLPTKIVSNLYNQKCFSEEMIDKGISKLYKETDSLYVRLCRILLELSGVAKKAKGQLILTKKGKNCLVKDQLLFEEILKAYCKKFNWGYFDGYELENIGRLGCGFSIYLLNKYGNEVLQNDFYAKKYFTAYPILIEEIHPRYGTVESYVSRCYSYRMFEQFGMLTGIIKTIGEHKYGEPKFIQKTELLELLFEVNQPNN